MIVQLNMSAINNRPAALCPVPLVYSDNTGPQGAVSIMSGGEISAAGTALTLQVASGKVRGAQTITFFPDTAPLQPSKRHHAWIQYNTQSNLKLIAVPEIDPNVPPLPPANAVVYLGSVLTDTLGIAQITNSGVMR